MRVALLAGLLFASTGNTAGLDPYTRNEDISSTIVTVSVQQLPDGLYKYSYFIESALVNKGEIAGFDLNIQCEQVADNAGLPAQETGIWFVDFSEANKHSPAVVFSGKAERSAPMAGFSANNWVGWGVFLKPGETASGFGLISTKSPVMREYKLTPSMDTGYPWDYSNVNSEDPDLPWIDDFTITGMAKGPGCHDENPMPSNFAGTLMPHETEESNALLTYSEPLQDRFHVPPSTGQVAITIHYAENLDADSFKLTPQRPEYRDLFHPEAGVSETVYVPLTHKKTKLTLSACPESEMAISSAVGKQNNGKESDAAGCSQKDRDVFEIRLSE